MGVCTAECCFFFIYQERNDLFQLCDYINIKIFTPSVDQCNMSPKPLATGFVRLVLFTRWLKYKVTVPWMSSLKGCDSLAGGWGLEDQGKGSFSATQEVSQAQCGLWIKASGLWDTALAGFTRAAVTQTVHGILLWVRKLEAESKGHTAGELVFPADGILLVRVWRFIPISSEETCNMHAAGCSSSRAETTTKAWWHVVTLGPN